MRRALTAIIDGSRDRWERGIEDPLARLLGSIVEELRPCIAGDHEGPFEWVEVRGWRGGWRVLRRCGNCTGYVRAQAHIVGQAS